MTNRQINLPLTEEILTSLHAGDEVLLNGIIYTARDQAHQRFTELLKKGQPLPVDLVGQTIYYAGPTPAQPGQPIGSIGPTTSGRMDVFTPDLLAYGLKGIIGKGPRNKAVKEALIKNKSVYFAAVGGAGALLAQKVKQAKVVAFADLGTEAVHELVVEDFPVMVINDIYGQDLYLQRGV